MLTTSAFAMSINTFRSGLSRYLPPQFKERDRSFPVPRGMIPMAGRRPRGKDDFIESITDKIQPTVPSPPQAKIDWNRYKLYQFGIFYFLESYFTWFVC